MGAISTIGILIALGIILGSILLIAAVVFVVLFLYLLVRPYNESQTLDVKLKMMAGNK